LQQLECSFDDLQQKRKHAHAFQIAAWSKLEEIYPGLSIDMNLPIHVSTVEELTNRLKSYPHMRDFVQKTNIVQELGGKKTNIGTILFGVEQAVMLYVSLLKLYKELPDKKSSENKLAHYSISIRREVVLESFLRDYPAILMAVKYAQSFAT
jgi:hypothetical protein